MAHFRHEYYSLSSCTMFFCPLTFPFLWCFDWVLSCTIHCSEQGKESCNLHIIIILHIGQYRLSGRSPVDICVNKRPGRECAWVNPSSIHLRRCCWGDSRLSDAWITPQSARVLVFFSHNCDKIFRQKQLTWKGRILAHRTRHSASWQQHGHIIVAVRRKTVSEC